MSCPMYVTVILAKPFSSGFIYSLPTEIKDLIHPGDIVSVPFGKQETYGVVVSFNRHTDVPIKKIKPMHNRLSSRVLSEKDIQFLSWMASYTMIPVGHIFKMMVPTREAFEPPKATYGFSVNPEIDQSRLTPKQRYIFESGLSPEAVYTISELELQTGVSAAVIKKAHEKGALLRKMLPIHARDPQPNFLQMAFNEQQETVVMALKETVKAQTYECSLIHGVTGSGKTEVYFEGIAEALRLRLQTVVLLPEISLTPQWLDRFQNRFGCKPDVWHSKMTPAARRTTLQRLMNGEAKVIVGARSALFLIYKNLGLIVVDEEHDGSYKQEEGGAYHARDMAVARAYHHNIPIFLVSATPSLESFVNAKEGKYKLLQLPERHGQAELPDIHLIDMKVSTAQKQSKDVSNDAKIKSAQPGFLSESLREKLILNYVDGEQSLLFLNRRGYAPLTLCRACGERLECPNCSAWVVLHKTSTNAGNYNQSHSQGHSPNEERASHSFLHCHHCDFKTILPSECKSCQTKDNFVNCGPGVERIAEEIKQLLPEARCLIMASDSFSTAHELENAIQSIQNGDIDIVIGTQMMAKGHHFPKLTVVGIVDADLGLMGGDIRACEKTFQLLQQVSGRCGRSEKRGDVYIQTLHVDHPLMQALENYDGEAYREQEILMRQMAQMPPFSRLVALIISGENQSVVEAWLQGFSKQRPPFSFCQKMGLEILGPTPAPLAKLRKRYRYRLLLKAPKGFKIQAEIEKWLQRHPPLSTVKVVVDVDPINFM